MSVKQHRLVLPLFTTISLFVKFNRKPNPASSSAELTNLTDTIPGNLIEATSVALGNIPQSFSSNTKGYSRKRKYTRLAG